ncbi:MAG: HAMP domain-containing sensor histidine kinase [Bacillota bacterium]|nr:HAMP domain-containing sensor histidine kinase [Bacillota bacterium]
MRNMYSNTVAKIVLAGVISVMVTASLLLGSLAIILESYGLFDKPLEEYEKSLAQSAVNKTAYSIIDSSTRWIRDEEVDKITYNKEFNMANYPGYDARITVNGKVMFDTYDKDEDYAYTGSGSADNENSGIVVKNYLKTVKDDSAVAQRVALADATYKYKMLMVVAAIVLFVLSVIGLVILIRGVGKRWEDDEIHSRFIDKLPWEISLTAMIILFSCIIGICSVVLYDKENIFGAVIICAAVCLGTSMIVLGWISSMAVQFKTGLFLRQSLIVNLLKLIGKGIKVLPIILVVSVPGIILFVMNIVVTLGFAYDGRLVFWEFILSLGVFALACYVAVMFRSLHIGAEKILEGNTDYKIDTNHMFGKLRSHAEALNNINTAVEAATAERMKSERMKTELITNVSHDIKTPLTSIINYTDLLAAEDLDNESAAEYIDGIWRNAQRLKKLTSDIVEVSKASTGNVPVNFTSCSVSILLNQALGEYEEQMEELELKPMLTVPEEDALVMVDGQLTWRIFDNLLNNICKYAQAGTRVYIDVRTDDQKVYVDFKNTSAKELNISASELMERFVRGDVSRNTDGSGLGLSIADNLARLQQGSLELKIDGDLFKATVSFRRDSC